MIKPAGLFWLLFLVAGISSCETDLSEVKVIASNEINLPVETSRNIEIIYSDSANVKARLKSPFLKHFKVERNPYYEMPEGLHVDFFNIERVVESQLSAKYGVRYENQGIIELRDSVVAVNTKGETLNTERLIWNEKTDKIYSNKFVKITTADKVIYGNGFESNQNFTRYRILDVKGIININENVQSP